MSATRGKLYDLIKYNLKINLILKQLFWLHVLFWQRFAWAPDATLNWELALVERGVRTKRRQPLNKSWLNGPETRPLGYFIGITMHEYEPIAC